MHQLFRRRRDEDSHALIRPLTIALALSMAFACALFFSQHARGQALLTPRDQMFDALSGARDEPGHALWFYISGLIGGANAASVMHSGTPIICDTHEFEDIKATEETIMRWLLAHDQISNPDIFLELAAPLAFAERYPCLPQV